ncbi:MAG TPA: outer membrane beta-barrel protein [Gemmatimonadaceae bacterium]|nr:outer membrane beta-barrel protein [Gemmatimonadaceae bacterium]
MYRLMGVLMTAAFGAVVLASPARAQTTSARQVGVHINVAGGLSIPLGDLNDVSKAGWDLEGGAELTFGSSPFSVRGDVLFNSFSADKDRPSVIPADVDVWGGVLDIVYTFPQPDKSSMVKPYVLGGLGVYHSNPDFDGALSDRSSTDLGINLGGGLRFDLSGFSTFAEARYHRIFSVNTAVTGGGSESFFPINFGVSFGTR